MDIERLRELRDYLRVANELSILNDDNLMQRIVDNNDVTNTIDIAIELLNAEIARQSVTDEAVQRAIEWMEIEKESAQNSWERAGAEWRMEPGTQEMHDEQMAAFDLAIQALCQMRTEPGWIKVSDRLPEKPEYDWVLVHITLSPDGFVGLPHVAELRHGEWFSTEYDLPIEQALLGTVTHWMPLPQPPESEVRHDG